MGTGIKFESPNNQGPAQAKKTHLNSKKVAGNPSEGSIPSHIGTGEDAKNSFIWISIRWSFGIGALLTVGLLYISIFGSNCTKNDLLTDVKAAWGIFLPVITLALGYAFGKQK